MEVLKVFTYQNLPTIMALAGWGVAGSFVLLGMFGMSARMRRKESDELADGLINRLQQTVDANAKEITVMTTRIDLQQKEIHQLQGKNQAYLEIISLRDPNTAKVFEMAPEVFATARDTNTVAKKNNESIEELTRTLAHFIDTLQPILINLELKKEPMGV